MTYSTKKRRTILWPNSALVVVLGLSGCGGGGGGSDSPSAATTTTQAVTAPVVVSTPSSVTQALTINFATPANYGAPTLPNYYLDAAVLAADNTPPGDQVMDKIATLGRVLFYDKNLSVNGTVSCASCHQQATGFSDPNRFSVGFSGVAFTTAHSMRLTNIRYFRPGSAFWDRRAASVEDQASQPIQNSVEMGFDAAHGGLTALFTKLSSVAYYPALFSFAFGDSAITELRVQRALAQFQRSMVSTNSRWDTGYASTFSATLPDRGLSLALPNLTAEENQGRALFMAGPNAGGAGCAACHVPPTFALAANSRSNGLDAGETTVFKSPSLKNVAQSRFFMHDGRFSTLAQVVEHYNSGAQAGPALDNRLTGAGGAPRLLNLTNVEKAALLAFLNTLNDPVLAVDEKFSNPFRP